MHFIIFEILLSFVLLKGDYGATNFVEFGESDANIECDP